MYSTPECVSFYLPVVISIYTHKDHKDDSPLALTLGRTQKKRKGKETQSKRKPEEKEKEKA
jgi:hypothetical protein